MLRLLIRNGDFTFQRSSSQEEVAQLESQRMVIHIQGGKGRKDRDIMLSPKLREELRAPVRRLPRRPITWLSPGNYQHSGDQPIDTKTAKRSSTTSDRRGPDQS